MSMQQHPYSFFNPSGDQNSTGPVNDNAMNEYYDQHIRSQQNQDQNDRNQQNQAENIGANIADQSKSLSSLTVADLVQILQPLQNSINEVKTTIAQQLAPLQKKVNVMENQLKQEINKNAQLTSVVINMQNSLNHVDAEKRTTNLIINGLLEADINPGDNSPPLTNDKDKFRHLLHKIGVNDLDADIEQFEFVRIGEQKNNGRNRIVKINVGSKEIRDKICKESKKVKLLPDPWKLVYINKDVHPVYLKENQRIRKRMAELKNVPGYGHETGRVKLENGVVTVDGNPVDKNLFFQ